MRSTMRISVSNGKSRNGDCYSRRSSGLRIILWASITSFVYHSSTFCTIAKASSTVPKIRSAKNEFVNRVGSEVELLIWRKNKYSYRQDQQEFYDSTLSSVSMITAPLSAPTASTNTSTSARNLKKKKDKKNGTKKHKMKEEESTDSPHNKKKAKEGLEAHTLSVLDAATASLSILNNKVTKIDKKIDKKAPPTSFPTKSPTNSPTRTPTRSPTKRPSSAPSRTPAHSPTRSTTSPNAAPTTSPINFPTASPLKVPTEATKDVAEDVINTNTDYSAGGVIENSSPDVMFEPSTQNQARKEKNDKNIKDDELVDCSQINEVYGKNKNNVSCRPSIKPSYSPSHPPSPHPTQQPTTAKPSPHPTHIPTRMPTRTPTVAPTTSPSHVPSNTPSFIPSYQPSFLPSLKPSARPTRLPTKHPTVTPGSPTQSPTTLSQTWKNKYLELHFSLLAYHPTNSNRLLSQSSHDLSRPLMANSISDGNQPQFIHAILSSSLNLICQSKLNGPSAIIPPIILVPYNKSSSASQHHFADYNHHLYYDYCQQNNQNRQPPSINTTSNNTTAPITASVNTNSNNNITSQHNNTLIDLKTFQFIPRKTVFIANPNHLLSHDTNTNHHLWMIQDKQVPLSKQEELSWLDCRVYIQVIQLSKLWNENQKDDNSDNDADEMDDFQKQMQLYLVQNMKSFSEQLQTHDPQILSATSLGTEVDTFSQAIEISKQQYNDGNNTNSTADEKSPNGQNENNQDEEVDTNSSSTKSSSVLKHKSLEALDTSHMTGIQVYGIVLFVMSVLIPLLFVRKATHNRKKLDSQKSVWKIDVNLLQDEDGLECILQKDQDQQPHETIDSDINTASDKKNFHSSSTTEKIKSHNASSKIGNNDDISKNSFVNDVEQPKQQHEEQTQSLSKPQLKISKLLSFKSLKKQQQESHWQQHTRTQQQQNDCNFTNDVTKETTNRNAIQKSTSSKILSTFSRKKSNKTIGKHTSENFQSNKGELTDYGDDQSLETEVVVNPKLTQTYKDTITNSCLINSNGNHSNFIKSTNNNSGKSSMINKNKNSSNGYPPVPSPSPPRTNSKAYETKMKKSAYLPTSLYHDFTFPEDQEDDKIQQILVTSLPFDEHSFIAADSSNHSSSGNLDVNMNCKTWPIKQKRGKKTSRLMSKLSFVRKESGISSEMDGDEGDDDEFLEQVIISSKQPHFHTYETNSSHAHSYSHDNIY